MSDPAARHIRNVIALLTTLLLLGGCADLPAPSAGAPADGQDDVGQGPDDGSDAPADPGAGDDAGTPGDAPHAPDAPGSGDGSGDAPAGDAAKVAVELDEWTVAAMPETVGAGTVDMTASNVGEAPHELLIVRGTADELPLDEDGAVDEDALNADAVVAEIERLAGGAEGSTTVDLEAGDYALVCNLVHVDGSIIESHYDFGMVDDFTVTAAD